MSFERVMSDLTAAVGNVERLQAVSPTEFDRLVAMRQRLIHAVADLYVMDGENENV
jgi:hypothetical protein